MSVPTGLQFLFDASDNSSTFDYRANSVNRTGTLNGTATMGSGLLNLAGPADYLSVVAGVGSQVPGVLGCFVFPNIQFPVPGAPQVVFLAKPDVATLKNAVIVRMNAGGLAEVEIYDTAGLSAGLAVATPPPVGPGTHTLAVWWTGYNGGGSPTLGIAVDGGASVTVVTPGKLRDETVATGTICVGGDGVMGIAGGNMVGVGGFSVTNPTGVDVTTAGWSAATIFSNATTTLATPTIVEEEIKSDGTGDFTSLAAWKAALPADITNTGGTNEIRVAANKSNIVIGNSFPIGHSHTLTNSTNRLIVSGGSWNGGTFVASAFKHRGRWFGARSCVYGRFVVDAGTYITFSDLQCSGLGNLSLGGNDANITLDRCYFMSTAENLFLGSDVTLAITSSIIGKYGARAYKNVLDHTAGVIVSTLTNTLIIGGDPALAISAGTATGKNVYVVVDPPAGGVLSGSIGTTACFANEAATGFTVVSEEDYARAVRRHPQMRVAMTFENEPPLAPGKLAYAPQYHEHFHDDAQFGIDSGDGWAGFGVMSATAGSIYFGGVGARWVTDSVSFSVLAQLPPSPVDRGFFRWKGTSGENRIDAGLNEHGEFNANVFDSAGANDENFVMGPGAGNTTMYVNFDDNVADFDYRRDGNSKTATLNGGATVSGGSLLCNADGKSLTVAVGDVKQVPAAQGAVVVDCDVTAPHPIAQTVLDFRPKAGSQNNRVTMARRPSGANNEMRFETRDSAGTANFVDSAAIPSAGRHTFTGYWHDHDGGAGAGVVGVSIDGGTPVENTGLTTTRTNADSDGLLALGNATPPSGTTEELNAPFYRMATFDVTNPIINNTQYDLTGPYDKDQFWLDIEADRVAYDAAVTVIDAGSGAAVHAHSFAGNSATADFRRGDVAALNTGTIAGGATISGGTLNTSSAGDSLIFTQKRPDHIPRREGVVIIDHTYTNAAGSDEVLFDMAPDRAALGVGLSRNRAFGLRTSAGELRVRAYDGDVSPGNITISTPATMTAAGRHTHVMGWGGFDGSPGTATVYAGIDGAAPTTGTGTDTRNTAGENGLFVIGNDTEAAQSVPARGNTHRVAVFQQLVVTVNGNVYDFRGAIDHNAFWADWEIDRAAGNFGVDSVQFSVTIDSGQVDLRVNDTIVGSGTYSGTRDATSAMRDTNIGEDGTNSIGDDATISAWSVFESSVDPPALPMPYYQDEEGMFDDWAVNDGTDAQILTGGDTTGVPTLDIAGLPLLNHHGAAPVGCFSRVTQFVVEYETVSGIMFFDSDNTTDPFIGPGVELMEKG